MLVRCISLNLFQRCGCLFNLAVWLIPQAVSHQSPWLPAVLLEPDRMHQIVDGSSGFASIATALRFFAHIKIAIDWSQLLTLKVLSRQEISLWWTNKNVKYAICASVWNPMTWFAKETGQQRICYTKRQENLCRDSIYGLFPVCLCDEEKGI